MRIEISSRIRKKLTEKHGVSEDEIVQCFSNSSNIYLEDKRAWHKTNPPTKWFIAGTDSGRNLKVVFMLDQDGSIHIKSAFEPNAAELRIYAKYA
ncbi:MAG: hypothetical protein ABW168_03190 [Sedimenticola sp.]